MFCSVVGVVFGLDLLRLRLRLRQPAAGSHGRSHIAAVRGRRWTCPVLTLVVLISGGGSNLNSLLDAADDAEFPARAVAIGADRDADGVAHVEERGIPSLTVPFSSFNDRDSWGDELLAQVSSRQPDFMIRSGFMRLLPPDPAMHSRHS